MDRRTDERVGIARLRARFNWSASTVARKERDDPEFPKHHYVGSARAWWWSEILAYEQIEMVRAAQRAAAKRARMSPPPTEAAKP